VIKAKTSRALSKAVCIINDLERDISLNDPGSFGKLLGPSMGVRTMCGLRTGGWSLPCVMSD
jgi:hypothetical protein